MLTLMPVSESVSQSVISQSSVRHHSNLISHHSVISQSVRQSVSQSSVNESVSQPVISQ